MYKSKNIDRIRELVSSMKDDEVFQEEREELVKNLHNIIEMLDDEKINRQEISERIMILIQNIASH